MLDGDDTDSIETGESYFLTAGAAYGDGAYVWMAQAKVKAAPSHRVKRKLFLFPHELQKNTKTIFVRTTTTRYLWQRPLTPWPREIRDISRSWRASHLQARSLN